MAERTNEEAIELFADLLEPVGAVLSDKDLRESVKKKESRLKSAAIAIRNHKTEVIQILALLEGVPVEEYRVNLLALPLKLVHLLNKPEVAELFIGAELMNVAGSSGSATENTEDGAN